MTHYERESMYAILNLLTTLAYDPISNLKLKLRAGEDVVTKFTPSEGPKRASNAFINSLLKDNFKLQRNETDSELSEWSETGSDDEDEKEKNESKTSNQSNATLLPGVVSTLRPPEKPVVFKTLRIENPEKWLRDNVQNSWWADEVTSVGVISTHPTANFCMLWQNHLCEKSLGFIKPRPYSLISEYCLLREIFWMFLNPVDCKFFKIDKNEIIVRPNVTLPSTMPESLNIFLNDILRAANILFHLKSDHQKATQLSAMAHTLETYFNAAQPYLDRIQEFVLEQEAKVLMQQETYTVVIFHDRLRPHKKMLEMLWDIHATSVLSEEKFPPHVCASHLIASLHHHVLNSCAKEKKNLAIDLLICSLKMFLEIFEVWWTEARLDDLKHEFLMEIVEENEREIIKPRPLVKSREKSFYLNDSVSKRITSDPIVSTMLSYSEKASFTLDIISKLNRVHEMRQIIKNSASLYEEFVQRIESEVAKFSQHQEDAEEVSNSTEEKADDKTLNNRRLVDDIRSGMIANDEQLLLLAFEPTFALLNNDKKAAVETENLYTKLNKSTEFMLLPIERSVQQTLTDLLEKKIAIADTFVMNIYFQEFNVEQHLQEIRKVFFLSNELSNFFHSKLFPQMDIDDCSWANPYLLTVAFNDAISSGNRQHSSTLFSVEVAPTFSHSVFDIIDGITIYFVNVDLDNVFTPDVMKKYNEGWFAMLELKWSSLTDYFTAFRFLLKIKWGQQILLNLSFPNFFKHRLPYASMQMVDLVIKRLALTRFAMLHSINSLHNHLMEMLQGLSLQLDTKVAQSRTVSELISHHDSFVSTFHVSSFLGIESSKIYGLILETLKLAKVLKNEWSNVTAFANLDETGSVDTISLRDLNVNAIEIEKAFGVCEYELKSLLDI